MKICISLVMLCLSMSAYAQGLLFSEYRMVFDKAGIRTLQVCNSGDKTRSFTISTINQQLDRTGSVVEMDKAAPPDWQLVPYIRFFPKRVTINAGKCQEVQIQVRMPSSKPKGEYRSFLAFTPLGIDASQEKAMMENEGAKMNIIFQVSARIPIIYRNGVDQVQVSVDSFALKPISETEHLLSFVLHRTGEISTYGTLSIEGIVKGSPVLLTTEQGHAVYHETNDRYFEMKIPTKHLDVDADGKILLTVVYADGEDGRLPSQKLHVKHHESLPLPPYVKKTK